MNGQVVKKVVIAGGGTAGWIAAMALARQLGPFLDIALVESEEIGTVGVGESTIPTTQAFHRLIGIDERAFVCATRSTFKLGILFEDWSRIGDRYIHSFGATGRGTWMGDFQHLWLEARAQGLAGDYGEHGFEHEAARARKFATADKAPGGRINYAYHLEASLYAKYLRGLTEKAGVRRIEGKIAAVDQDPETGFIRALALESGERVEGDLFIDCTGFRGLLIEQTLKAGFEDWRHWLPTDSAIAVQTKAVGPAVPYTRAIAHRAGWQWRIPLQHRVGNGLVFASEHMDEESAQALLRERLEGEMLTEPRLIRFKAGRRRKVWDRNCIALGLASGFIEPLESTSIHLIMIAVTRLIQSFPFGGVNAAVTARFNDQSARELIGIRDFIILHYRLNQRDDGDFWPRMREVDIPDTLAQRIDAFRESALAWQDAEELFRIDSWVQVMLGQRLEPKSWHRMGRLMKPAQLEQALRDLRTNVARAVAAMPDHQAFLDGYCATNRA